MSFLIDCPNCGNRGVHEFRFGGEVSERPSPDAPDSDWHEHFYLKRNVAGHQQEWWYHSFGCRRWFVAIRDTIKNRVDQTFWPSTPRPKG